ncbi:MAG: hypothetical protein KGN84_07335, partial [Acidobacteriota bacterium]|nr:hypothetical protein [Acidobacteriota bacterium]
TPGAAGSPNVVANDGFARSRSTRSVVRWYSNAWAMAMPAAMVLRPSDPAPRRARAEALIKAGKPEAAESLMQK